MPFQVTNPIRLAEWDNDLRTNRQSGFFHTSAWAAVLAHAYRYRPVYFTHRCANRLTALLPVMEIRSALTGRRGVSLPFTDACPPLAQSDEQLQELVRIATIHAVKSGWRTLQLRTDKPLPSPAVPERCYSRHCVGIENKDSDNALEKKVRKSTLRNVRRAIRAGVRLDVSQTRLAFGVFYQLNCMTRKRHGLPPQPWYFFEAIYDRVIRNKKGRLFLAYYRDCPIAGSIFFQFHKQAYYKYGASDQRYQQYRANNLLMWEALQHYRRRGFRSVDFGRTEPTHTGLLQFKRGWGGDEDRLYYYRFDTRKQAFITKPPIAPPGYRLFSRVPIPLARLVGRILYPHVG